MDATPLPPALRGDKRSLSREAAAEIQALNGARPIAFTFQLIYAWGVIAAAIAAALYLDQAWATILAIVIIATRHNVLGLLVHEQTHLLGYRGRFGDLIVNLFAGYPLLVLTVENYAQVHLAHHRDYFGDRDPDFIRKSGPEWSFPKSKRELLSIFLSDLVGINTIRLIRGKRVAVDNSAFVRRYRTPSWVRPLYFVVLATVLTYMGWWTVYIIYWLLPLMTISQVIVRWGAICEHIYNLPGATVVESTPLIILSWWERLILPNLNFAMHSYHHYFPGVSFICLPKVHEIFVREGLVDSDNVFYGYGSYFKYITQSDHIDR